MRRIFIILGVLAVLWSGYWLAARSALEGTLAGAFRNATAEGQHASYATLAVGGFPGRFVATLRDATWGTPGGAGAQTDQLRLSAPSYLPTRMSFNLGGSQRLTLPTQQVKITPQRLSAGLTLAPDPALGLAQVTLDGEAVALTSTAHWQATLGALKAGFIQTDDPLAYRFTMTAREATPGRGLRVMIDPKGALPATIGPLDLAARVTLSAPLDRHAEEMQPHVTTLEIDRLAADWGPVRFAAKGKLTAGADGFAEGTVTLTLRHWQTALDVAEATGLIPPANIGVWRNALKGLSGGSADPDEAVVPIVFTGGEMRFGFLPLGPAPRFAPAEP